MKAINSIMLQAVVMCSTLTTQSGWALDSMNDQQLSNQTGQDGITVKLATTDGAMRVGSISLIDRDGFAGAPSAGALSYVPTDANTALRFYQGNTVLTGNANPLLSVIADTDAGTGTAGAFLNLNLAFSNQLSRINLGPFALGVTSVDAAGKTVQANRRDLIRSGADGVDILLNTANPLGINFQLGNQPQGSMMRFTGSLQGVSATGIQILSYSGGQTDAAHSASFDLAISPNLASNNGIRLDGTYAKVATTGLEIGNAGTLDKFDVQLNNVTIGQSGASAAGTFDGLSVGSIGNIGLIGVSITGLKTTVSGL